ncbi:MAG TPA: glycosyltransferase family 2 protein [Candidatus Nanoarchaeia archaeon]|nr:glycosyltransferase family 2 protein [Candidatus Nanoarchaeia archaeon]
MRLSIVIPAYNEEATIAQLIELVKKVDLKQYGVEKEILVIDDGSKDETIEIVNNISGVKLIVREKNGGKGAAVKTGIEQATGDIIIIQDADLEYDPQDYYKCIKPIIDGRAKVVYGSRFLSEEQKRANKFFLKSKHEKAYNTAYLGGRFLTLLANTLYWSGITDEATCYKTFDAKLIKSIKINGNRFEWEPEILAKVRKRGEHILEVPISYYPRTFEEGKKINWKDGVQAIWTLVKYRFVD